MRNRSLAQRDYPLVIIGGGILGVTLAYLLSLKYQDRQIVVLETEADVAQHSSRRNTGVLHRPFYLDPETKARFARCAEQSYHLWKKLAQTVPGTPWLPCGTLEVAIDESQLPSLATYKDWSLKNGMKEYEVDLFDAEKLAQKFPHIKAPGAVFVVTDTSVDFQNMTQSLRDRAMAQGVHFLFRMPITGISEGDQEVFLHSKTAQTDLKAGIVINCSGAGSLNLAQQLGMGRNHCNVFFRGDYWEVDAGIRDWFGANIYSVPRFKEFPFLDPHWVRRAASGLVEIGPTAIPVPTPTSYDGVNLWDWKHFMQTPPTENKWKLLKNSTFLSLAVSEWRGAILKSHLAKRMRQFIPELRGGHLTYRGLSGIRASLVDESGHFVSEAQEYWGRRSLHIVNYNSPGATGAPAFAADLFRTLLKKGWLDGLKPRTDKVESFWDIETLLKEDPVNLPEPLGTQG